jgi:membrane-associated phospholipid phosphatase
MESCVTMETAEATDAPWLSAAELVVIVVAGAIAIALAIAVLIEPGPLPGELSIVRWWQRIGEPVPTLAEWVRLTTSTEACLIVFAIPAVLVIKRHRRAGGAAVAIAVLTMLVAQPVLKEVIDRPRPSPEQVDVRAEYDSKSFPSGHSMSSVAAWGCAALVAARHRRPLVAAALCVPVALTSVASLVQGVHWPSDSTAGLMIGGISAIGTAAVLGRAEHRRR